MNNKHSKIMRRDHATNVRTGSSYKVRSAGFRERKTEGAEGATSHSQKVSNHQKLSNGKAGRPLHGNPLPPSQDPQSAARLLSTPNSPVPNGLVPNGLVQNYEQEILAKVSRSLSHARSTKTTCRFTLEFLAEECGVQGGAFLRYNRSRSTWSLLDVESQVLHNRELVGQEFKSAPAHSWLHRLKQARSTRMDLAEGWLGQFPKQLQLCFSFGCHVIPLWVSDRLWGCLLMSEQRMISHPCATDGGPPPSSTQEISHHKALIDALAGRFELALLQAQQFEKTHRLNIDLERQIRLRTHQLQLALELEERLKSITDKVRDSLDEDQILQVAVTELGMGLGVSCCETLLYNSRQTEFTIRHEYITDFPSAKGQRGRLHRRVPLHKQLLSGNITFQLCPLGDMLLRSNMQGHAILACPIQGDKRLLGHILLYRPQACTFGEMEIRTVQQVANQCAIALRQARLYQAAQQQVSELERLNALKDDFIDTVSHELRTPMTSMRLAIKMLEMLLAKQLNLAEERAKTLDEQQPTTRYFNILTQECEREITLINNLLNMQELSKQAEAPQLETVNFDHWLGEFLEPYRLHLTEQNKSLRLHVPHDLPLLSIAGKSLRRILSELIENALKHSPPASQISVSATMQHRLLEIQVQNTGIEIPEEDWERVFEKFYRVQSTEPWNQGGTGLGLAMVKQLVANIGGQIQATSDNNRTSFTLKLPQPFSVQRPITPAALVG